MKSTTKDKKSTTIVSDTVDNKEITQVLQFTESKIAEINDISKRLSESKLALTEAKKNMEEAKKEADETKNKAGDKKNVHWYNNKSEAINNVQEDVKRIAETQVKLAKVQTGLAEAQQRANEAQAKSFEFQQKLADIAAIMVNFSVVSSARSNMMVREIELRLNGASKEKLSDLAKKELENVVYQIKAQQDTASRQEQTEEILYELDKRLEMKDETDKLRDSAIEEQMNKGLQRDLRITEHEQKFKEQYRILSGQIQKSAEQERVLLEIKETDTNQDIQISKNAQDIDELEQQHAEQDKLIAEGIEKDKEQDAQIIENAQDIDELEKQDAEQDRLIAQVRAEIKAQNELLEKQTGEIAILKNRIRNLELDLASKENKTLFIATAIASIGALAISFMQFFI